MQSFAATSRKDITTIYKSHGKGKKTNSLSLQAREYNNLPVHFFTVASRKRAKHLTCESGGKSL